MLIPETELSALKMRAMFLAWMDTFYPVNTASFSLCNTKVSQTDEQLILAIAHSPHDGPLIHQQACGL